MGMHSIMESVLEQFYTLGEEMLTDILKNVEAGRWEDAARAAHSLKGASGSISASALYTTAAKMETHAREADVSACLNLFPTLKEDMEHCLQAIPPIIEECKAQAACES